MQSPYLDHMIDLEVVDNLDLSIDLEVDNLEVNMGTGVDLDLEVGTLEVDTLGVDIDTEVDFGVHIEVGVDTLEVAPQTQMKYLEVSPQALTKVAPQAVIGHLEVG